MAKGNKTNPGNIPNKGKSLSVNKIEPKKPENTGPLNIIEKGFWKRNLNRVLILSALAIALYAMSISYEYVLDDKIVYTDNVYTKKGINGLYKIFTTESFEGFFKEQRDLVIGARYRPLSLATFALEHQFFKVNSYVSHTINILLYALTGLILFRILSIFFKEDDKKRGWLGAAFISSLLFVLHPIHSEVVANVKGRDEILMLLFSLLGLLYALKYVDSGKKTNLYWSGLMLFLGMMSKETALTFVAIIPLSLYFFTSAGRKQVLRSMAPAAIASIIYIIIRYNVIGYFLSSGKEPDLLMNNPFLDMRPDQKYATIFYTLLVYLKLLVFPHPLTHDYYPYQIPKLDWSDIRPILSLLIHAVLLLIAILGLKKKKIWSYGILFYLITLSITSNLPFTVGTFMNERFMFAPSVGFCLIIGWLISKWNSKSLHEESKNYALFPSLVVGLIGLGYIGKTLERLPAWKNTYTLNEAAVKVSKNSARANSFMATALFEEYKNTEDPIKQKAILDNAEGYVNKALKIVPDYNDALTMKSGIATEKYKLNHNLDSLLISFGEVLEKWPSSAYINEYMQYLNTRADKQKLLQFYHKIGYEILFLKNKNLNFAAHYLLYGKDVDPNDPQILVDLGKVYLTAKQTKEGEEFIRKAQSINPNIQ